MNQKTADFKGDSCNQAAASPNPSPSPDSVRLPGHEQHPGLLSGHGAADSPGWWDGGHQELKASHAIHPADLRPAQVWRPHMCEYLKRVLLLHESKDANTHWIRAAEGSDTLNAQRDEMRWFCYRSATPLRDNKWGRGVKSTSILGYITVLEVPDI